jgi:two-component system, LytTR family, response regulator
MQLNAIIIDDEASARETLSGLIRSYTSDVRIVGEAFSVKSGLEAIQRTSPDVVFLDISMLPHSGFDLLEKLPEINFEIIFTTAYDRYALKAIKFSALDYLLKPIDPAELVTAVEKVKSSRNLHQRHNGMNLFNDLQKKDGLFNKIVLPCSSGLMVTELKDIIRCEGIKSYTAFFLTNNQQVVVCRKLKEFEEMLDGHGFLRIFQSHLINLNHIKRYIKGRGGQVEMTDNAVLPVSRERKNELIKSLKTLI